MGQDPGQERTQLTDDPAQRAAALRTEIEETREELGDTAAALAAKTDVKARARNRAEEIKQNPAPAIAAGAVVATLALLWLARRRTRSA